MFSTSFKIVKLENSNFHAVANGSVGGHRIRIVLDTGASHSCIDTNFVQLTFPDVQLEVKGGVNAGIGGEIADIYKFRLPKFKIGRFCDNNLVEFVALDLSEVNKVYKLLKKPEIQMILGSDFFVAHNAIIDFGTRKLHFTK